MFEIVSVDCDTVDICIGNVRAGGAKIERRVDWQDEEVGGFPKHDHQPDSIQSTTENGVTVMAIGNHEYQVCPQGR